MPDVFIASKTKQVEPEKKELPQAPSALAAFISRPKNIHFETQGKKEKIILLLRRHWVTNFSWVLTGGLLVVAPVLVQAIGLLNFLPGRFQFITLLTWYLITAGYIFERFLNWFFNVNIITDERVVDIDFPSILYRDISSAKIGQIQDVSIKVGGFIRSLLNYGDVFIQTAGAKPEIEFEAIPRPEQVAKALDKLMLEEKKEKLEGRVR